LSVSKGLGFSIIHDSRLDPVLLSTPEFMAFLYEGFIINEFEKKFGFKPILNTGK
jgi:hypothetical protein